MRSDGKTRKNLFLAAFWGGFMGSEYFYVKKWKIAWIKLIIAWIGATITTITWITYGSAPWLFHEASYNTQVVTPSVIGGLIFALVQVHSYWNCTQIYLGKFKDEHNQPVSMWNLSKEEYVKAILA